MLLPVLLAFSVIGWEQLLHTRSGGGGALPYEAFHWFSDGLLALPLACAAVWIGERLAQRQHFGNVSLRDLLGRAALVALAYSVLLVPGAVIHEAADTLTHAHALAGAHSHVAVTALDGQDPASVAAFAVHALSDGLVGQLVGLPVALVTLLSMSRWSPRRTPLVA